MKFCQVLAVFSFFPVLECLVCYSCTSTLSSAIDPSGKLALRVFLDTTYNLPPVHRLCNSEDHVEFRTVNTAQCAHTDECIKISAENHGIHFVLRGCKSQIHKPNVGIQAVPCQSSSPSICLCGENLCNSASTFSFSLIFIVFAFSLKS